MRTPLHHTLDRDLTVTHTFGDGRHATRTIIDGEAHIIRTLVRTELRLFILFEIAAWREERRHDIFTRDVDNITRNRRCGRVRARPRANQ
jgi:hypothetical protein